MYKPGQLLTINHAVYRVIREEEDISPCCNCHAQGECFELGDGSILCTGTPWNCYLQLVKPKSSLG